MNRYIVVIFIICFWKPAFSQSLLFMEPDSVTEKSKIQNYFKITLNNDFYFFENADFKSYQQKEYEKNQAFSYKNTDDRIYFAFTLLSVEYKAKLKNAIFEVEALRYGFWGNDNLEGKDNGKNPLSFSKLYVFYHLNDFLCFTLGRQTYTIGNALIDYLFYDTIDGLKIKIGVTEDYYFEWMGDCLGIASKPETYVYNTEKDDEIMKDFQGNTLSLRTGFTLQMNWLKLFGYYLKYGANNQGGADRAENGLNSLNKPDGDFLSLSGIRIFGNLKYFKWDLTYAICYGKDYQQVGYKQYQNSALFVNWSFSTEKIKILNSLGYFSPEFCSMKGYSMGGLLLYSYKGYFPSSYAGSYHFTDYSKKNLQTYVDITNSKSFAKLMIEINYKKLMWTHSILMLAETQTRHHFKYMGIEQEITFEIKLENLILGIKGALYIPSNYYREKHISYPYVTEGKDFFYGLNGFCSFSFEQ